MFVMESLKAWKAWIVFFLNIGQASVQISYEHDSTQLNWLFVSSHCLTSQTALFLIIKIKDIISSLQPWILLADMTTLAEK